MTMRVIVGSRRFPTPLVESRIISVVFNPLWNVPLNIARNEILPRLQREASYLRDNDIRIVGWPGDPYGELVDWRAMKRLPILQLQQQPGPKNALGRIKFDIPNRFSIYLHDTPGKAAFNRDNRSLSHGCVRLQRPEDVARYVLRGQLRNDPDLIERLLETDVTISVNVTDPLPVVFVYWTAFVADDGRLHFRNDVYERDAIRGEQPYLTKESEQRRLAGEPSECSAG